ncbi:hypothetical protein CK203_112945 [Vitis vinifera]|uniref:R13L1/DRL21-like LRR repeat region domain-containing protein n=1 Tax=Vitis vinifera TaxID=29760 RepID=A0A438CBI1_VITVI|nr:hypothetical protein CK203_112945 [Vitis vinifera]
MAYLTGTLHISKLENAVKNAVDAMLKEKESLVKLVLEWSDRDVAGPQDAVTHGRVLEDLQPHSNLKELRICHFRGMQELQEVEELQDKCPQGNNVSLEKLKIRNCPKLAKLPSFPKLRKLKIKKWRFPGDSSSNPVSDVDCCPKLHALPQVFAPQKLEINRCELLRDLPNPECFRHLQHLAVDQECQGGKLVGAIPDNSSLCSLVISNISNVNSFPKCLICPVSSLAYSALQRSNVFV